MRTTIKLPRRRPARRREAYAGPAALPFRRPFPPGTLVWEINGHYFRLEPGGDDRLFLTRPDELPWLDETP